MVYFLCKAYDSDRQNCYFALSLPVRGAWIEISATSPRSRRCTSLPVRGAWIEIVPAEISPLLPPSRSPCGERGLKSSIHVTRWDMPGRSPCGERGLKWNRPPNPLRLPGRSPCGERGLKCLPRLLDKNLRGRSPCGERGLKCRPCSGRCRRFRSLPVRGAWIEM